MRIALISTSKKDNFYPIGLLKIGAYLRSCGHICKLFKNRLPGKGRYEEIWISTLFTFEYKHSFSIVKAAMKQTPKVKVGGICASLFPDAFRLKGVDVHVGLFQEAESFAPDFSLLGNDVDYSIVYTSRGCSRKCKFCMVHRLQPNFINIDDWEKYYKEGTKKIIFQDNNYFAKDKKIIIEDMDKLKRLIKKHHISSVDFNQGLDCRILDKEIAEIMKDIPISPVRFAFDGMHEDGHYQNAIETMSKHGFKNYVSYMLYNFTDDPLDYYYRLSVSADLSERLGISVSIFPMKYQQIDILDKDREFIGKKWTRREIQGVMCILNRSCPSGVICFSSKTAKDYLKFWYGKDKDEFKKLINYPKIGKLCDAKKGKLRILRTKKKANPYKS